ncbi:MAG: hypothetical protein KC561_11690, partial [Myxococcales bacterium]|nr:hypothetical protein [Myxococcales bacterium]
MNSLDVEIDDQGSWDKIRSDVKSHGGLLTPWSGDTPPLVGPLDVRFFVADGDEPFLTVVGNLVHQMPSGEVAVTLSGEARSQLEHAQPIFSREAPRDSSTEDEPEQ